MKIVQLGRHLEET